MMVPLLFFSHIWRFHPHIVRFQHHMWQFFCHIGWFSYFFFIFDGSILTLCSSNITYDSSFLIFGGSFTFFSHLTVPSSHCAIPTSHLTIRPWCHPRPERSSKCKKVVHHGVTWTTAKHLEIFRINLYPKVYDSDHVLLFWSWSKILIHRSKFPLSS